MSLLLASLLMAQAAPAEVMMDTAPQTLPQARLDACAAEAARDPATAISTADQWLEGLSGTETSYPRQCLGHAYVALLRWDAARDAFVAARDARTADDVQGRARLGAMAGNAALAAGDDAGARALLEQAGRDAGDTELGGQIAADMAMALVPMKRIEDAQDALARARTLAPQYVQGWLLSAALMRRMERLDEAQTYIATAAGLAPSDGEVALEAGVIAALRGDEATARANFAAVQRLAPDSPMAATARGYVAQLDGEAP